MHVNTKSALICFGCFGWCWWGNWARSLMPSPSRAPGWGWQRTSPSLPTTSPHCHPLPVIVLYNSTNGYIDPTNCLQALRAQRMTCLLRAAWEQCPRGMQTCCTCGPPTAAQERPPRRLPRWPRCTLRWISATAVDSTHPQLLCGPCCSSRRCSLQLQVLVHFKIYTASERYSGPWYAPSCPVANNGDL